MRHAQRAKQLSLLLTSGRGEHLRAGETRKLHRGEAHTARRRLNKDAIALPHLSKVM